MDAMAPADGEGGSERPEAFVQSLARGLAVIRAFDAEHTRLTLSEVARETGLTRAAARRFLLTLVELGYVRSAGRLFELRPRVLELGYAYLSGLSLPEVARPHMEQLAAEVHESCSLSVLDGDDIVYVTRVPTKRIMTVAINVGTRFPAHATSMGRVLLAAQPEADRERYLRTAQLTALTRFTVTEPDRLRRALAEARDRGWALVDQELEEGLRSIAVPVRDGDGAVLAAMNISASARHSTPDAVRDDLLPALQAAAREIELDLRRSPG
ncbi:MULTISPECIES: IclR family transcriptional regulator domain-containing protein [unclassified Modestobacter]|uniref:IclR family transcriptional regulator domain-containing protein n=1 Tax=unclassified Modestobacter TaxID=2643866 RepID=UPI0022AA4E0C|nr:MULTISPECIES: IclR family transcriptional regulator C-terminal domain-containing protein [unclassified Modestobacter]MCZ2824035.1 helix-turn-helix domain-containing protein [Modestobacter sp. VKM Ac-2981]MCZ2852280.1 helix-turn-helix domain-containing protein [Modestobacter sp. VKM Ac-2982]